MYTTRPGDCQKPGHRLLNLDIAGPEVGDSISGAPIFKI